LICASRYGGLAAVWVRAVGELDASTIAQLEQALSEAEAHALLVILDLGGVASIDRAGANAIVNASRRARDSGRRLILVTVPLCVQHVWAVTDVVDAVDIDGLGSSALPGPDRLDDRPAPERWRGPR
jgi:anti-anti-sigma factor